MATTTTTPITADKLYQLILVEMDALNSKGLKADRAQWLQRFTAHIRAVTSTKHATLLQFHNNGSSEDEKQEVYTTCLKAYFKNKPSMLKGSLPEGQAKSDDMPGKPRIDFGDADNHAIPDAPETPAQPEPAVTPRVTEPAVAPGQDVAELIRIMQRLVAPGVVPPPVKPEVDEKKVREIVEDYVDKSLVTVRKDLSEVTDEAVSKKVETWLGEAFTNWKSSVVLPARQVVEIVQDDVVLKEMGRQHYKFELLCAALQFNLNVMLVGPAGSSKSESILRAFEALGHKEFEAMSVGPQTSKSDLLGNKDAHGNYHDTPLVRAWRNGKAFLLDELDRGHAGVLTILNMSTSNGFLATPDGLIKRHPKFLMACTANTYGSGANRVYVGANQLDGATLDRFAMIDWPIDEGLEWSFVGESKDSPSFDMAAGGLISASDWTDLVQRTRRAIDTLGIRHIVSPRATLFGAKLRGRVGLDHLQDMLIWKGLDQASCDKIRSAR
jgi:hypothetical protein